MPYKFDTTTVRNDKGFCYIIEFSNGVIKPGKTKNLLKRFNQHKTGARILSNYCCASGVV